VNHVLVTNDFPPKTGGIQSYLWELWRRLDPHRTTVLTTPHEGSAVFDARQPMRVERTRQPVLLPEPWLRRRIDALAAEVDADLVLLDPALPLGLLGRSIERPYGLVLHGAEVTIPGRLPGSRRLLAEVLRHARLVVAAGGYPAAEGERAAGRRLPLVVVPPGVDVERFTPLATGERQAARQGFGLDPEGALVVSVSRLVPRKGMDTLIEASGAVAPHVPGLQVAIAGSGRDRARLERLAAREHAPVRFLGRVADDELPLLYGCADLFAMLCRDRWGGLEQEGFGIVFLEAAACAVAQVAGRSGGSHEAVVHGRTGLVVDDPTSVPQVAGALTSLLTDPRQRRLMGEAARRRTEQDFTYDVLARRLQAAIDRSVTTP
jgi:phosphatidyl-myo-inositol dimannoside synthase